MENGCPRGSLRRSAIHRRDAPCPIRAANTSESVGSGDSGQTPLEWIAILKVRHAAEFGGRLHRGWVSLAMEAYRPPKLSSTRGTKRLSAALVAINCPRPQSLVVGSLQLLNVLVETSANSVLRQRRRGRACDRDRLFSREVHRSLFGDDGGHLAFRHTALQPREICAQ